MPDYNKNCIASGLITCQNINCIGSVDCGGICNTVESTPCSCSCPAPLANSHYISDNCTPAHQNCFCGLLAGACRCRITTSLCNCSGGQCQYECDAGYIWNGSACVIPSKSVGNSNPYILLLPIYYLINYAKKKRKKKAAILLKTIS